MRAPFSGRAFDEINVKWYLVGVILVRPGVKNVEEKVDCLAYSADAAWAKVQRMLGNSGVVNSCQYMGTMQDFEREHGADTDFGLDFEG